MNDKTVSTPTTTKKQPEPKVENTKKDSWKRNTAKGVISWHIKSIPGCDLTPKALKLLQDHGETNITHRVHDESSAQEAISMGHNYSPAIYKNGIIFGSLGELESYYKRNFFSTVRDL